VRYDRRALVAADLARYSPGAGPLDGQSKEFPCIDGGYTWKYIGSGLQYTELATYEGTTIALRSYEAHSPGNPVNTPRLVTSRNLSSGQPIDNDITEAGRQQSCPCQGLSDLGSVGNVVPGAGGNGYSFLLDPNYGNILADTSSGLWDSSSGGRSWMALASPNLQPLLVAVQPPVGGDPWHVCAAQQILADPAHEFHTADS
jgi:hypothetical protein